MPCRPRQSGKLLTFATTGGLGNQFLGLRAAWWLALALNRTLVLPPVLRHFSYAGPLGNNCSRSTATQAAAASRALWERMERRGEYVPWNRLLAFGSAASVDFQQIASPSYVGKTVQTVSICGSDTAGWAVRDFVEQLRHHRNADILRFGRLYNGLDTDALNLCQFAALGACVRDAAARALQPTLAPVLRQSLRTLLGPRLGHLNCAHVRSGYGETAQWQSYVEAAAKPIVAHLRVTAEVERPVMYVASDVSWARLRALEPSSAFGEMCRLTRCVHREAAEWIAPGEVERWAARWVDGARVQQLGEVSGMAFDLGVCALASRFWHSGLVSGLRASSFATLIEAVRAAGAEAATPRAAPSLARNPVAPALVAAPSRRPDAAASRWHPAPAAMGQRLAVEQPTLAPRYAYSRSYSAELKGRIQWLREGGGCPRL